VLFRQDKLAAPPAFWDELRAGDEPVLRPHPFPEVSPPKGGG
jgi:hypothetical protein